MTFQFRAIAAVFLGMLALPAFAQTFGEITGKVSDASGAAAPGAVITATNPSTNATRQTVSGEAGDYTFPSLLPGTYNLRVEKSGFKVDETKNVQVSVQQVVRLDFALVVGQVSSTLNPDFS